MNHFRVTFDDGDSLITGFNGTLEDAKAYYISQRFCASEDEDGLETFHIAVSVEVAI